MTAVPRLLWALLGMALGYALRRPICEREHRPRHLDPAIVRQPPEGDDGLPPPEPRTWTWTCTCSTFSATSLILHSPACPQYKPLGFSITASNIPWRTWPDTLEHDEAAHLHPDGGRLRRALGCPRCEAER